MNIPLKNDALTDKAGIRILQSEAQETLRFTLTVGR